MQQDILKRAENVVEATVESTRVRSKIHGKTQLSVTSMLCRRTSLLCRPNTNVMPTALPATCCLCLYLPACACVPVRLSPCLPVSLSAGPPVCLSACLPVCLSACLSTLDELSAFSVLGLSQYHTSLAPSLTLSHPPCFIE
jgi:hypothetical protein